MQLPTDDDDERETLPDFTIDAALRATEPSYPTATLRDPDEDEVTLVDRYRRDRSLFLGSLRRASLWLQAVLACWDGG